MRNDPVIRAADEKFNGQGYIVFTKLLEIVGQQSPHETSDERFGKVELTVKTLEQELNINIKKLAPIGRFLAKHGLLRFNKKNGWVKVSFPKMALYKDNYTKNV